MKNKKGQIGTTITLIPTIVLLFLFAIFYLSGTLALKIKGEDTQKSMALAGEGTSDTIVMQNIITLQKNNDLENQEKIKKICPYYYLQTEKEEEYFVNPTTQQYSEIQLLINNQLLRRAELYYPEGEEIKTITYRQELEC